MQNDPDIELTRKNPFTHPVLTKGVELYDKSKFMDEIPEQAEKKPGLSLRCLAASAVGFFEAGRRYTQDNIIGVYSEAFQSFPFGRNFITEINSRLSAAMVNFVEPVKNWFSKKFEVEKGDGGVMAKSGTIADSLLAQLQRGLNQYRPVLGLGR